jgi:thiamine biosynthesis lipoprotein
MGVEVVVLGAADPELGAIRRLFDGWDRVFSRFRTDSELSRVNRRVDEVVVVSPLFAQALGVALAAARATGGLVDPTLGAALVAAGYDRDFSQLDLDPGPPGRATPGAWRSLRLAGRVLQRPPRLQLDLNGVVKALAVDEALRLLAGPGLVAAGGDVATRRPVDVGLPGRGSVRLRAGGLATSGTTRRRWLRAGRVQHHLIDAATGLPSAIPWTEVTVAAETCLAADVAAKAAFLLGLDGPGWLDEQSLPGRFVRAGRAVVNDAWRRAVGNPLGAAA